MAESLVEFAALVRDLAAGLVLLEADAAKLGVSGLAGREWYDLLVQKLAPQLSSNARLIVAVAGGTNIGKSVIFNHICGFAASEMTPKASGTKHPTILAPAGSVDEATLRQLFPGFDVVFNAPADAATTADERHRLFVRESHEMPPNLLVLDTPDIDSDAPVNWERADAIRRASDVLVAVLTMQKYNDRAVRQFFGEAAREGRLMWVVFNQLDLPEDEADWPGWLTTFCEGTGASPETVLLAPRDRKAAQNLTLPFHRRPWPQLPTNDAPPSDHAAPNGAPVNLRAELSTLRFDAIKLHTLAGSLRELTSERGLPDYLAEVRSKTTSYETALAMLASHRLGDVRDWPGMPTSVLVDEIRAWWHARRSGWTKWIHDSYGHISQLVTAPVQAGWSQWAGPSPSPLDAYRGHEWEAMLDVIDQAVKRLDQLADAGHPQLTDRLRRVLGGSAQANLMDALKREQREHDPRVAIRELVAAELATFEADHPDWNRLFQWADAAFAAARPALTVTLMAFAGPIVPGTYLLTDLAGGALVTAAGDAAITEGAGRGLGWLKQAMLRIDVQYRKQRIAWLHERLKENLLIDVERDLRSSAAVTSSESFRAVDRIAQEIGRRVRRLSVPAEDVAASDERHGDIVSTHGAN